METLFVSGPPAGGKTTLIRLLIDGILPRAAHLVRMRAARDGHTNAVNPCEPVATGFAAGRIGSVFEVTYTSERVFETLPDALRAVRKIDRRGFVVIEADSDPALRHAYPYDYRIFVMSGPEDLHDVFRSPRAAADALQQVMQDTAAFAAEIFGLFDGGGLDDSAGVEYFAPSLSANRQETVERLDVSEGQIRQFLSSPIGAEIASRIQLQPDYHALVESDIVVVNTGAGSSREATAPCIQRLEKLLARVRHDARRHSVLYWGDITRDHDPTRDRLIGKLKSLVSI